MDVVEEGEIGIMLILTRTPGESLKIGEDIVITVLEVNGRQVRIGIDAPDTVHILRSELQPASGIMPTASPENLPETPALEKTR